MVAGLDAALVATARHADGLRAMIEESLKRRGESEN
jgi:hypothetical protein